MIRRAVNCVAHRLQVWKQVSEEKKEIHNKLSVWGALGPTRRQQLKNGSGPIKTGHEIKRAKAFCKRGEEVMVMNDQGLGASGYCSGDITTDG